MKYSRLGECECVSDPIFAAGALKGLEFTRCNGMDQDVNGIWTTLGGDKVAWSTDPEDNTVSLTEFVRRLGQSPDWLYVRTHSTAACGAFGRAELSAQEPPVTVRAGYLWSDESVMRQQGTLAVWNDDGVSASSPRSPEHSMSSCT